MATASSFKQQCPSCEAMVPVRDPKLIGKKIDCPKCKFRFVVEEPDVPEEEEAEEEKAPAKSKKSTGVTAKAPAKGKSAGAAAKGKKKAADDDEEGDEDDRPKKKKKGGSSMPLILGLVAAGVAIALLGVAAIFMFGGGSEPSKPSGPSGPVAGGPAPAPAPPPPGPGDAGPEGGEQPKEPKEPEKPKKVLTNLADVTNLLPNDSEGVVMVNMDKVRASTLGRALFDSAAGFRSSVVKAKVGLAPQDVTKMAVAFNLSQKWRFLVLRTSQLYDEDQLKKTLGITTLSKGPKSPINNLDYYKVVGNELIDNLGKDSQGPMMVHFMDAMTVVVANQTPMEKFLEDKGKPKTLSSAEGEAGSPSAGGAPMGPMGAPMGPPMGSSAPPMGSSGPPPGGPGGCQLGAGGPGGGSGAAEAIPPSAFYMTVKPTLKQILDRSEGGKQPALISFAIAASALQAAIPGAGAPAIPGLKVPTSGEMLASALRDLRLDRAHGAVAFDYGNKDQADQGEKALTQGLPALALILSQATGTKVETPAASSAPGGPGGSSLGPPAGGSSAGPPGGRGGMPPGTQAPGGQQPPMAQPPGGQQPGGTEAPEDPNAGDSKPKGQVWAERHDQTVMLVIDVGLTHEAHDKLRETLDTAVAQIKGQAEMAGGRSRVHELANAVKAYVAQNGQFPRGALERRPTAERAGLPWPPDQRLSWVVEFLPYLGYGDLKAKINMDKSWKDPSNLLVAGALIPPLVDSMYPDSTFYVTLYNPPGRVAATHWVGVAGVGLDAAEYLANDAGVAKKLGVFGYDRQTKVSDIKDGPADTILLLQTPAEFKMPWIAGGGATVQGVPETDSVRHFVCSKYKGKNGTFAIMANGDIRFIHENVPDDVFKAMCTIASGEKVDVGKYSDLVTEPIDRSSLKPADVVVRP